MTNMPVIIDGELLPKALIRRNMPVWLLFALVVFAAHASAQTTYTFTTFSVPNSTYTDTYGITESGDVTGYYGVPVTGLYGGFVRTANGKITVLSYPGQSATTAYGMNKFDVIVGTYATGREIGGFFYHAGSYRNAVVNGQPAALSDINDYGYYVGSYGSAGALTGFLASPAGKITIIQYPGGFNSAPVWIKNGGEVIGTYQDRYGNFHTFVWSGTSGYKTISIPGVPGAQIGDINSSRTVVGGYFNGVNSWGFAYEKGKFQIVQPPGASDCSITAVNNKGQLVGGCGIPTSMGFIATPVP